MSNTSGGGLESSTLPDFQTGQDDSLIPLDDDIEFTFTDEAPVEQAPQQRRGQNEDNGGDSDDLGDIENPGIRNRIMRERRLREEFETRATSDREQLEAALLNSEKSKLSIQRDAFKLSLDGVDVRIRTATEALKMARSDGDVNSETDIEAQINELRTIRDNINNQMGRLPNEQDLDRAFQEHVNARRQQAAQRRPARQASDGVQALNNKAGQWQANNAWMSDRSRTAENASLLAINNQLVKEGFDANDDEFFTELSRRMAKSFPSLGVKDLSGRSLGGQQGQQRSSAPPVAGGRGQAGTPTRQSNQRKVDLDRSDRIMMRALNIDVTNKQAVAAYAKNKLERLRSEQSGR